jgi:tetratricopeptide (TPR) repeat protein
VLSNLELALGDRATARSLYEERSAIWRELGAKWAVLSELSFGAILAREEEDYATARSLLEESVRIQREWDYNASMISDLTTLGDLARREGDRERATALLCEAVELASELGMKLSGCESIEALAKLAAAQGRDEQAVRLFGATEALREAMAAPLPPSERAGYDDSVRLARTRLDGDGFKKAWAQGRSMSLETAIEEALTAAAAINGGSLPHRALTHPRPLQDSQKARNR